MQINVIDSPVFHRRKRVAGPIGFSGKESEVQSYKYKDGKTQDLLFDMQTEQIKYKNKKLCFKDMEIFR